MEKDPAEGTNIQKNTPEAEVSRISVDTKAVAQADSTTKEKNLFTYSADNLIREGDTVLMYESADQVKQL